jgi:hypothetical protein
LLFCGIKPDGIINFFSMLAPVSYVTDDMGLVQVWRTATPPPIASATGVMSMGQMTIPIIMAAV